SRRQEPPSSRLAREDAPTGEPDGPHEADDDGPDYSDGLPDQRRGLRMFAALIGLALAGSASGVAYWAWFGGRASGDEARMIGASIGPDKTMPSPQENSGADERLRSQADAPGANAAGPTMTGDDKSADAMPAAVPVVPPTGILYGPAPAKVAALTS